MSFKKNIEPENVLISPFKVHKTFTFNTIENFINKNAGSFNIKNFDLNKLFIILIHLFIYLSLYLLSI